ncbi:hypothetical protein AX17_005272 [Amanita inopinata Kibby_2008]|nr:hypothetical protein AX17_005272 [Amanita inopinata Kibby_2008]
MSRPSHSLERKPSRTEKVSTSESNARRHDEHRESRSRYDEGPRSKDGRYKGGYAEDGDKRYADRKRDERRREYDSRDSRYGYGEQERERERQRDRNRYDREGERDRERSARRSASPHRSRSALSASRDGTPSSHERNKAKPNFAPSGLLAAETNTVRASSGESTVLKYNEPPEARKPIIGWRLYVFKGEEQIDLLHIHRQSAYLVGRDRLVADIAIDHGSCSKQHAAIQYRFVQEKNEFGVSKGVIKPFIIDLESTNGTHVNGVTIPVSRFYELKSGDVIKFGTSAREYVLLHDESV